MMMKDGFFMNTTKKNCCLYQNDTVAYTHLVLRVLWKKYGCPECSQWTDAEENNDDDDNDASDDG